MPTRNYRKLTTWQAAVRSRYGCKMRLASRTKAYHYWQAIQNGVIIGFFIARRGGNGTGTLDNAKH